MADPVPGVPYVPPIPSYMSPDAAGTAAPAPRPNIVTVDGILDAGSGHLIASWHEPRGQALYLTRMTVQADSDSYAYVYVGSVDTRNLVSGTTSGTFDENDPNQPYYVPEGTPVNVEWTTGTGSATARFEYVVIG